MGTGRRNALGELSSRWPCCAPVVLAALRSPRPSHTGPCGGTPRDPNSLGLTTIRWAPERIAMAGDAHAGTPQGLGKCTACGKFYPIRNKPDGSLWPIGTGGECRCGGTDFEAALQH